MKLNELGPNVGAKKNPIRVGRGIGSGKGKTAGKGQKGQKSRSGVAIKGFEGGQMPLDRRLPKMGFKNIFRKNYAEISLAKLQTGVDTGLLNSAQPIDEKVLLNAGLIRRILDGVRVIGGGGTFKAALTLTVTGTSGPAKAAIEAAGGSVILLDKTPAPVRNLAKEKRHAALQQ